MSDVDLDWVRDAFGELNRAALSGVVASKALRAALEGIEPKADDDSGQAQR